MFSHKESKEAKKDTAALDEKAEAKELSTAEAEGMGPGDDKMISIKESEYQKLVSEAAENKEKFVRIMAEFENARKRSEREKAEFVKYANEGLISEFLGILDDLQRTVAAAKAKHEDYDAFLKGIEMVTAHIYDTFKKNGVRPIESVGKPFDPEYHEALMQEETDKFGDNIVMEELQKGYMYGDRVVRTAKVKVAKSNKQDGGAE